MTNRLILAAVALVCATALAITLIIVRDDPEPRFGTNYGYVACPSNLEARGVCED